MTEPTAPTIAPDGKTSPWAFVRRHLPLFLLMLTFAVAFIDRQLLAILQESIKADLGLSDSQLGLLSGTAFALFYIAFGIPIGRLADRWVRRDLIAVSLAAWSVMTALTGFAQSFLHLALARIGVAVGEAGCNPAAYSLIADTYAAKDRATATAFYNMGASVGMLAGFLLGGWLEVTLGWRGAFFVVGLPGILLAVVLRFTIKEPPRAVSKAPAVPLKAGLALIGRTKTLIALGIGVSFSATAAYGPILWGASFFIRTHGMTALQVGPLLALALGVGGGVTGLGAGLLADRLGVRDQRWRVWVPCLVNLISLPLWVMGFVVMDATMAVAWLFIPLAFSNAFSGVSYALVNGLVPATFRATASAVYIFLANGIGMGIGVLGIGALSDLLNPAFGIQSIQYALLIVVPAAALIAGLAYLWAGTTLVADQAAADIDAEAAR